MSDMIEVETVNLVGPALDWAVAKIEGVEIKIRLPYRAPAGNVFGAIVLECLHLMDARCELLDWSPSTDWSQGGPLRDKYSVAIYDVTNGKTAATLRRGISEHWIDESEYDADATGVTALIAMCRAIVRVEMGDTVQVPAELVSP